MGFAETNERRAFAWEWVDNSISGNKQGRPKAFGLMKMGAL
jgi:hypothetical protein